MLTLLFTLGDQRYGIPSDSLLEIIPVVKLRKIPHVPAHVAGLLNYRGTVVPVIDLCQLTDKRPCRRLLSTRIIVSKHRRDDVERPLGLMAERVTETIRLEEEELDDPGLRLDEAPFLGKVSVPSEALSLQLVEIDRLLPDDLQERLFAAGESVSSDSE